jgi:hypothetical protein
VLAECVAAVTEHPHVFLSSEEHAYWRAHIMPEFKRVAVGRVWSTVLDERPTVRVMDGSPPPYFPTELSSAWLSLLFEEQRARTGIASKRVPSRKVDREFLSWPQPEYFRGGAVSGDLAYVDGHRMYFSLYRAGSLDLRYCPDGPDTTIGLGRFRFLGHGELEAVDKLALQAVSGIFRATHATHYHRGRLVRVEGNWNRFLAPGLWGYMSDTLHAIAGDAVDDFGACYVHTDGWIMPGENAQRFIDHLASAWRIEESVKCAGPSVVTALGRWQVGERQSVLGAGEPGQPFSNLRPITDGRRRALQRAREWAG